MIRRKSITVCGYVVPIRYLNIGTTKYGEYDPNTKSIYLNTNKDAHWNNQVLFHELLHAIFDLTGIGEMLPPKVEHAIITALENHLWPLIKFLS